MSHKYTLIEKYKDLINWDAIKTNKNITTDFINLYNIKSLKKSKNKIFVDDNIYKIINDNDFTNENIYNIDWEYLCFNYILPIRFIETHIIHFYYKISIKQFNLFQDKNYAYYIDNCSRDNNFHSLVIDYYYITLLSQISNLCRKNNKLFIKKLQQSNFTLDDIQNTKRILIQYKNIIRYDIYYQIIYAFELFDIIDLNNKYDFIMLSYNIKDMKKYIELFEDKLDWDIMVNSDCIINDKYLEKYNLCDTFINHIHNLYSFAHIGKIISTKSGKEYLEKIIYLINEVSLDFILQYIDKLQFNVISLKQNLPEDFIEKYSDKLKWSYISEYSKLSHSFILNNLDKINWKALSSNLNLTPDILNDFKDKLDWYLISKTFDFFNIEEYDNYFDSNTCFL